MLPLEALQIPCDKAIGIPVPITFTDLFGALYPTASQVPLSVATLAPILLPTPVVAEPRGFVWQILLPRGRLASND